VPRVMAFQSKRVMTWTNMAKLMTTITLTVKEDNNKRRSPLSEYMFSVKEKGVKQQSVSLLGSEEHFLAILKCFTK